MRRAPPHLAPPATAAPPRHQNTVSLILIVRPYDRGLRSTGGQERTRPGRGSDRGAGSASEHERGRERRDRQLFLSSSLVSLSLSILTWKYMPPCGPMTGNMPSTPYCWGSEGEGPCWWWWWWA